MRIDRRDVERHYQSMSDGELLSLNRDELTEVAQSVYDEEIARRGLGEDNGEADQAAPEGEEVEESGEETAEFDLDLEEEGEPDWLEEAASACSFSVYPGSPAVEKAGHARAVLRDAGIPCHLTARKEEEGAEEVGVMVPGPLALHATSILDRDFFNDEFEENWRTHLEVLSDRDLTALDPKIFCAGFLDRVARMKKAYSEEMARRNLRAKTD